MNQVIAGMTLSLDGFVTERHGHVTLLYPDMNAFRASPDMQDSIRRTGAVVIGRRTFDMAEDPDWYAGNYEYQVPIFVVTHQAPQRR